MALVSHMELQKLYILSPPGWLSTLKLAIPSSITYHFSRNLISDFLFNFCLF